jgi:hypothetical protein
MTYEEFDVLFELRVKALRETGKTKGLKYTEGSGDRLDNFKREAEAIGLTPLQVWSVYFGKHLSAAKHYIKTGKNIGEDVCNTHVHDCIMYLFLLEGLIKEQQVNQKNINTETVERDVFFTGNVSSQYYSCEKCSDCFISPLELKQHLIEHIRKEIK